MRAILLSAGLGVRLKPITDKIPKVMVPLNGKPCLQYHIENLRKQKIVEFAINTHYFPEKIRDYLKDGEDFGVKIRYSYEPEILGTSGALNNFMDFFNETFVVVYADVLANFNLKKALKIHNIEKADATIVLDTNRDKKGKGVVRVSGNKVLEFIEKPEQNIANTLINSGFYILEPSVLKIIPAGFSDFGKDVLPRLVKDGKVAYSKHKGYIFDIGTIEDLEKAETFIRKLN